MAGREEYAQTAAANYALLSEQAEPLPQSHTDQIDQHLIARHRYPASKASKGGMVLLASKTLIFFCITATIYLVLSGFWCIKELETRQLLSSGMQKRLLSIQDSRWAKECIERGTTGQSGAHNSTEHAEPVARASSILAKNETLPVFYGRVHSKSGRGEVGADRSLRADWMKALLEHSPSVAECKRQLKALHLPKKDRKNLTSQEAKLLEKAEAGLHDLLAFRFRLVAGLHMTTRERRHLKKLREDLELKTDNYSLKRLEKTDAKLCYLEDLTKRGKKDLLYVGKVLSLLLLHKEQRAISLRILASHRLQNKEISVKAANAIGLATLLMKGSRSSNMTFTADEESELLKISEGFLKSLQEAAADLSQLIRAPSSSHSTLKKRAAKYHSLQQSASMYALQLHSVLRDVTTQKILKRLDQENLKLRKALEKADRLMQESCMGDEGIISSVRSLLRFSLFKSGRGLDGSSNTLQARYAKLR